MISKAWLAAILADHLEWVRNESGGSRADLSGADLPHTQVCPEEGAFIGWKKLAGNRIAKLAIGADCERVSPIIGRKCRADAVVVLAIVGTDGTEYHDGTSLRDAAFRYVVDEMVKCAEPFDPSPLVECSSGIHFFISQREAVEWNG